MHRPVSFGVLLTLGTGCAVFTRPAASEPVDLAEVRADGLEAALDAQKGKVVLVDFWATWCGPCVKKFPHFVETGKKYRGLVCVSVNVDKDGPAKGYDKGAVLDFLRAKEAAFPNYVLLDHEGGAATIERRFGLTAGVPFMALFGRDGRRAWDSEAEPLKDNELDKRIEAELAK